MNDPIADLETKLTSAARRRLTATVPSFRRWRHTRRGLGIGVIALVVAGSAAAAVVQLTAAPSKPLAGPVDAARPSIRAYAVSLLPDLRAGQAGWCGLLRLSSSGRLAGAGMGCGPARSAGAAEIAAGGIDGRIESIAYAVVTPDVRTVRFANTLVATRRDPSLPHRWRYAISITNTPRSERDEANDAPPPAGVTTAQPATPRGSLGARAPVLLDANNTALPATTPADDNSRTARSRLVTKTRPARRCVIGQARGFVAGYARVALGRPQIPRRIQARAFASCANTIFHPRSSRGAITVAILLDALDPDAPASTLPATPGLSGQRLGPGWLVAYGGDATQRRRLLARLSPHL